MTEDASPSTEPATARAMAVARVAAGEPLADVALRFNIAPAKLSRWAGLEGSEAAGTGGPTRPRAATATIIDLAERTGLSKSVVSRALRGQYGVSAKAKERVEAAAAELGYVSNAAAQNLSSHRTNTIGVLVRDASAAFYGEMQSAIQKRGSAEQQRVFITSGALDNNDEIRALEDLIALRVDGLIISSGRLALKQVKRFSKHFPVVVAGRPDVDDSISSVHGDEDAGARDLAQHLVTSGHTRVAVLQPPLTFAPVLHRRTAIMGQALQTAGVQVDYRSVHAPADLKALTADDLRTAGGATAFMAPNDRYAAALLASPARRDRAFAVTGFDGLGGLANELIGLTTWRQPIEEIGSQAVNLLLEHISGSTPSNERRVIAGSLIVSRSA